jgi:hypothetical protein
MDVRCDDQLHGASAAPFGPAIKAAAHSVIVYSLNEAGETDPDYRVPHQRSSSDSGRTRNCIIYLICSVVWGLLGRKPPFFGNGSRKERPKRRCAMLPGSRQPQLDRPFRAVLTSQTPYRSTSGQGASRLCGTCKGFGKAVDIDPVTIGQYDPPCSYPSFTTMVD